MKLKTILALCMLSYSAFAAISLEIKSPDKQNNVSALEIKSPEEQEKDKKIKELNKKNHVEALIIRAPKN
jgi:hypothetical protein